MKWRPFAIAVTGLLFIPLGCTGPSMNHVQPEPPPLLGNLSDLSSAGASLDASSVKPPERSFVEPPETLTLRNALSLALLHNPDLAGFAWEIRAREARNLQASLLPNPEVDLEVENFGGSDEKSDLDGAETTVWLRQRVELGEKRSKRSQVAAFETCLAQWDYETKRLDVFTETTYAFVDTLAAQERLRLAEETFRLSEQVLETVAKRVSAGKVSPLEETKASLSHTTSKIELDSAERNLRSVRKRLASLWGSEAPGFEKAVGDLYALSVLPAEESLIALIDQSPEIARWDTELEQRRAAVELEKSRRIPDVTLSGGARRFEETDDHAFVFAASVPLPLIDRNQGNILEAQFRLAKAEQERTATEIAIRTTLTESYEDLSRAYSEVLVLKDEVLPAAESAFNASRTGYQEGKFGFLEVLDAQRTLFDALRQYVEAAAQHRKLRATVERLIGAPLEDAYKDAPTVDSHPIVEKGE